MSCPGRLQNGSRRSLKPSRPAKGKKGVAVIFYTARSNTDRRWDLDTALSCIHKYPYVSTAENEVALRICCPIGNGMRGLPRVITILSAWPSGSKSAALRVKRTRRYYVTFFVLFVPVCRTKSEIQQKTGQAGRAKVWNSRQRNSTLNALENFHQRLSHGFVV